MADSTTVNVGVIQGGVQSNTIPTACRMEIDLRTPVGVSTQDLQEKVEEVLAGTGLDRGEIDVEWVVCLESAYSAPDKEIVQAVAANARRITGREIEANVSYGSHGYPLLVAPGYPCGDLRHGPGKHRRPRRADPRVGVRAGAEGPRCHLRRLPVLN